MKKFLKNLLALSVGLVIAFIILEVFLRVFNPIPVRIKGDKIILPITKKYVITNTTNARLDKIIYHTKNSLGFRGPEKPANFENYLSIITIGGSTTECFYQSDNKTWPYLLEQNLKKDFNNIWLNNAGLDGHSTFGHQILLEDHIIKIKPKIVLFYAGINDVGRDDLNMFDKNNLKNDYATISNFFTKNSEAINLIVNIIRGRKAQEKGVMHFGFDINKMDSIKLPEEEFKKEFARQNEFLRLYKIRLLKLINTSKLNGIEPILITQPKLWGKGIDSLTGKNLENLKLTDHCNSKLDWEVLELYNEVTKEVGRETETFVIDIANEMPKNSLYYYDAIHYTNEGAEKTADIIYIHLKDYLKLKYKSFLKS